MCEKWESGGRRRDPRDRERGKIVRVGGKRASAPGPPAHRPWRRPAAGGEDGRGVEKRDSRWIWGHEGYFSR